MSLSMMLDYPIHKSLEQIYPCPGRLCLEVGFLVDVSQSVDGEGARIDVEDGEGETVPPWGLP